ncbi:MAG: glycosyltransferase family 2 protein [Sphingomonas sp.]
MSSGRDWTASGTAAALSIGICTRNRPVMLMSLLAELIPAAMAGHVEIIVVDSASSPSLAAVVAPLADTGAPVRLLRLDQPGVSRARNAAIAACATPWLAFIDDDEVPQPRWVDAALALIDRLPSDCAACGGNVVPRWPGAAPLLSRRARGYLSLIEHAGEFDQTRLPHFGIGHSVVRVAAMREVGGFDPRLGRDGFTLLSGEEADLIDVIVARGWRVWHSDAIAVEHLIPPERLERSWLVDRAYWEGISIARRFAKTPARARALGRLARQRRSLLAPAVAMMGATRDLDLRLAFAEGVLAEQAAVTPPAASARTRSRAGSSLHPASP